MENIKDYLTVAEYAKKIGVPKQRIYGKIQYGSIEAKKINGKICVHKDTKFEDNRVKTGKYVDWRNQIKEIKLNLKIIDNKIWIENNDEYDIQINKLKSSNENENNYTMKITKK